MIYSEFTPTVRDLEMNWLIVLMCLSLAGVFGCIAVFEDTHGRWVAAAIAAIFAVASLVIPGMGVC
jgi:membrane protein YdbS with pleckstrin-like domain